MDSNHDIVPTLRMMGGVMVELAADEIDRLRSQVARLGRMADTAMIPGSEPTHRCKVCGAYWRKWNVNGLMSWNLNSHGSGKCCDNTLMADQIEELAYPAKVGGDGREGFRAAMLTAGAKDLGDGTWEWDGNDFLFNLWRQARAALSAEDGYAPQQKQYSGLRLQRLAIAIGAESVIPDEWSPEDVDAGRFSILGMLAGHAERAALSADGGDAIGQKKATFLKHEGAVETGVMLRAENRIALVTYQGRVEWYDANEFGGIQLSAEGGDKRAYPDELTDDMREVLGWLCYQCAPYAHAFRKAGASIKTRAEDEQAFVLHWLVKLVLDHPDDWRKVGAEQAKVAIDAANQAKGDA